MKIRFASDLHHEFRRDPVTIPEMADDKDTVMVLAGDIAVGLDAVPFVRELATRFRAVIYVPGNHEYYGHDVLTLTNDLYTAIAGIPNAYFLFNDVVGIGNVTFVGTPLWSDLVKDNRGYFVARGINDFSITKFDGEKFTFRKHTELHYGAKAFLEEFAKIPGKKVAVTHFLPTYAVVADKYAGDSLNCYFVGEVDHIIPDYDAWIFGHTHESVDRMLGNCRAVCNPGGYYGYELNNNFDPYKVIEV